MKNKKMLPFKTSIKSPKVVNIAKEYLNSCFELKAHEYESGHGFDFDKAAPHISRAIAVLIIAGQIKAEQSEAVIKFLAFRPRERSYT